MQIRQDYREGKVICYIEGEINIDNSPELRKLFDSLIRQNIKKVVINFSQVSYIDSSGLATLIEMLQRLRKINGEIKLCNIYGRVRNIFEITKIDRLFEIYNTEEEAIRSLD